MKSKNREELEYLDNIQAIEDLNYFRPYPVTAVCSCGEKLSGVNKIVKHTDRCEDVLDARVDADRCEFEDRCLRY